MDSRTTEWEPYLTAEQAAQYLGLAVRTIYNRVQKGAIPHHKRDGILRFRRSELDAWLQGKDAA